MKEICGIYYESYKLPVGTKVWFEGKYKPFSVRASNVAFAILTRKTGKYCRYTIIDWQRQERGAENLIFGMGAESEEECREMLERLTNFESEVSYRNCVPLNITKLVCPTTKKK